MNFSYRSRTAQAPSGSAGAAVCAFFDFLRKACFSFCLRIWKQYRDTRHSAVKIMVKKMFNAVTPFINRRQFENVISIVGSSGFYKRQILPRKAQRSGCVPAATQKRFQGRPRCAEEAQINLAIRRKRQQPRLSARQTKSAYPWFAQQESTEVITYMILHISHKAYCVQPRRPR